MKRILFLIIFISWSFLLTACSNNAVIENETLQDSVLSEPALEETTANEEFPLQTTEWQDKLEVPSNQVQGNIVGYTLIRTDENLSYIRDADYLIEENAIGTGIFVSEHMAETEAFLGQLLMEVLDGRGEIAKEYKSYFTGWAIQQLEETNWKLLDSEWTPDRYAYDRFYTLNYIWGNAGYDFTYTVYADNAAITKPETQAVQVNLSIDCSGMICGINVDIYSVDKERSGILYTPNTTGLFHEEYQEQILEEGVQLISGDVAEEAQRFGALAILALESHGSIAQKDKELFIDEKAFQTFSSHQWKQTGKHWKTNRFYDCYRTNAGFLYYIYPDYKEMNVETAKAVTFRFSVDTESGKITDTKLSIISMTKEQYQAAKECLGKRTLVVENGEIRGGGNALISIPQKSLTPIPLKNYTLDSAISQSTTKQQRDERIFTDEELQPYLFGQRLWKELAEHSETLGISGAEEGWQIKEGYDGYYDPYNRCAGSNHYCYYFNWQKTGGKQEKVLRIDTWVSENEVIAVEHNWFTAFPQERSVLPTAENDISEEDIAAFLSFDWTADSVLWEHSLQPNDSAQGWGFSVADINFDGVLEMLVTFSANHCGQNCLYVYQQDKNGVHSLMDTIATFHENVCYKTDYGKLSPYLDIELLDAYVNESGALKYLSLDYSLFGGDSKGGLYTLYLYETVPETDFMPKELVRIDEIWTEGKREISFLGEKVYELGALCELLAAYMDGYTKQEIRYITAKEMFPRDIISWNDSEKEQELRLLYDALLDMTRYNMGNEKGTLSLQETENGNTLILYDKQNQIIDTISVIEKTSIHQLTDNIFEIVQSVGSPAHYIFYYDVQNCILSDVFFNPILVSAGNEPKYAAYIENGELIIRDLFDEAAFYKKVTRDFTKTADPTSAIIGITLEEEGRFKIEYYQGEDYIQKTEIIDFTIEK